MSKIPTTPAIRQLKENSIDFEIYQYKYEEKGGTKQTASELNVDEHSVIKTLALITESDQPLIALMHGDKEVSLKDLARFMGVKKVQPCTQKEAQKYTGYKFGGTSPFGTAFPLPVYAESTIFDLNRIYINGGKQGLILGLSPFALKKVLEVIEVNVAAG